MGNKMKKLLCALLASAMLVTSVGMVSFAANDDTEAATEATETVAADDSSTAELTDEEKEAADAESESTEVVGTVSTTDGTASTPASAGTSYDNDNYYQKALSLCSSLGIISGYEDGSVRPESKVTRAEMASIVLRMLAINSYSKYQSIFTDVSDSHWAADQIQSAYEGSIISGMGDGTFVPDGEVTYAQVIVMLVNAMNYTQDAEYYGGWQQGYIQAAGLPALNLLKNAPGEADVASERGVVIKMVYNALLGDYKEITSYSNGQPVYSSDKTLAESKFDVIEKKGLLLGTAKTSIGSDLNDGQIEILEDKEEDSDIFDTNLTGLEEYIGQKVTYYYKEKSGLASEVLAVVSDSSKSETYNIDPDDIEKVSEDGGVVSIKLNKVSKERKTTDDVSIIYNGKVVTEADLTAAGIEDITTLFQPEEGTIKLVKSDKSKVDDYDVVFIDSYETIVVTSATDTKIIGKRQKAGADVGTTESVTINLDDTIDRTVTVIKGGEEARARNLKKNDVASIKRSLDESVVDIEVTGESITGSASSMSKAYDDTYATINGTKYFVANVAAGDLKTGVQCTFYFDKFGKIGYIAGGGSGRLQSGEQYGWIMEQYQGDGTGDKTLKIMTQDGKVGEYGYANSVKYWAPGAHVGDAKAGASLSKKEVETEVADILANDKFEHMWISERNDKTDLGGGERPLMWTKSYSVRLVKFKVNGSNKLTELYCAVNVVSQNEKYYSENQYTQVNQDKFGAKYNYAKYAPITDPYVSSADATALKESDALIYDMTNKNGATLVGGLVGGYNITDSAVEFTLPNDATKYTNSSSYTVGAVNASKYNQRENGVGDDFFMADFDGSTPAVIMRFVSDPDSPVSPTDLDTAANIATMIVDSIGTGIDADDETVYTINGYSAGQEVTVTTKTTSALGYGKGIADRKYTLTDEGVVWTGKSGESIAKYLHKGDVILTDNGSAIVRIASAQDIYNTLRAGGSAPTGYWSQSETRNKFILGPVTGADTDDISWISVDGNNVAMDASNAMDIIEIDLENNNIDKAIDFSDDYATASDVEIEGDDPNEYDYAIARIAPKGALGEVVIYRILNAQYRTAATAE